MATNDTKVTKNKAKRKTSKKAAPAPTGFGAWLHNFEQTFYGKIALSFVRAFAATFVLGLVGVVQNLSNANGGFSTARDALYALVIAAVTAGIRAVQAFFEPKS